jgi:hypothetical protein
LLLLLTSKIYKKTENIVKMMSNIVSIVSLILSDISGNQENLEKRNEKTGKSCYSYVFFFIIAFLLL